MVDAEGTYTYTYDNADELTNVDENGTQVESYIYDSNGNRTGTGFTTTVMNEQTASPGYTYTYDNAGNMISSTNTSTHVTTTYTYDYRNRLTEVTTGGTIVATYVYDALNRRIGIDDTGTQTWTVYDGINPYADFNGSGTLKERYLFGAGVVNGAVVDEILARTSSGGSTAWYLPDKLGSVRDIVDSSGNELDHVVYGSFGNILTETDAANGDRFKYAGMEYDSVTGQYYDRARYYDAAIGRFMSRDPMGFRAGDADLYRYVCAGSSKSDRRERLRRQWGIRRSGAATRGLSQGPGEGVWFWEYLHAERLQAVNEKLAQLRMDKAARDKQLSGLKKQTEEMKFLGWMMQEDVQKELDDLRFQQDIVRAKLRQLERDMPKFWSLMHDMLIQYYMDAFIWEGYLRQLDKHDLPRPPKVVVV